MAVASLGGRELHAVLPAAQSSMGLLSVGAAGAGGILTRAGRLNSPRTTQEARLIVSIGSSSSSGVATLGPGRGGVSCMASASPSNSSPGVSSGRDASSKMRGLRGSSEGFEEGDVDEPEPSTPSDQTQQQFLEFPKQLARQILRYDDDIPEDAPKVKVRLSVHYRCYNRQMLCIGGSNIPFGWSFLSIAKVPMSWTEGDNWTTEVEVPLGTRLEYKYVILEEQDWTKQENEDVEGVVTTFRVSPGEVPDVQSITKKMAIVAWQPGPNRMLVVPKEDEFAGMVPGESKEREPGPSRQERKMPSSRGGSAPRNDVVYGTFESIKLEDDSTPVLERTDVWGYGDWISRQSQGPQAPVLGLGNEDEAEAVLPASTLREVCVGR